MRSEGRKKTLTKDKIYPEKKKNYIKHSSGVQIPMKCKKLVHAAKAQPLLLINGILNSSTMVYITKNNSLIIYRRYTLE